MPAAESGINDVYPSIKAILYSSDEPHGNSDRRNSPRTSAAKPSDETGPNPIDGLANAFANWGEHGLAFEERAAGDEGPCPGTGCAAGPAI